MATGHGARRLSRSSKSSLQDGLGNYRRLIVQGSSDFSARVREDYWPLVEPRLRPIRNGLRTFTATGRAVGVLAILCWVVAVRFGWAELAVVAVGALVLVALASLFMLGHTDVEVRVSVEPVRVTAGDPVAGEVSVTNRARTPLLPLTIEVPVGEGGVRFGLPIMGTGKRYDEIFVVPTQRRGVIPVGPVSTVRGDALGLFRRDVRWSQVTEIFVHPKITPLEPLTSGLIHDLEGRTSESASPSDLAFHALREYVPGDDLRHVHWRSTAKHGTLLVRQFLDTRRAHLCVILDSRAEMYESDDDFEVAVSVTGSLLTRAILDGYDTSMVSGDLQMLGGNSRAALDICSRVEPTKRPLLDVSRDCARLAADASLVVVVTGAREDHVGLQRSLSWFSHEVTKLALRVEGGGRSGLRTGGDFPIVTLSALAELPGLLKWGV